MVLKRYMIVMEIMKERWIKMSKHSPRVIIGKTKGDKIRCRHPSELGGYINHTFSSPKDAKEYYKNQSSWAKNRALCKSVRDNKKINIK